MRSPVHYGNLDLEGASCPVTMRAYLCCKGFAYWLYLEVLEVSGWHNYYTWG